MPRALALGGSCASSGAPPGCPPPPCRQLTLPPLRGTRVFSFPKCSFCTCFGRAVLPAHSPALPELLAMRGNTPALEHGIPVPFYVQEDDTHLAEGMAEPLSPQPPLQCSSPFLSSHASSRGRPLLSIRIACLFSRAAPSLHQDHPSWASGVHQAGAVSPKPSLPPSGWGPFLQALLRLLVSAISQNPFYFSTCLPRPPSVSILLVSRLPARPWHQPLGSLLLLLPEPSLSFLVPSQTAASWSKGETRLGGAVGHGDGGRGRYGRWEGRRARWGAGHLAMGRAGGNTASRDGQSSPGAPEGLAFRAGWGCCVAKPGEWPHPGSGAPGVCPGAHHVAVLRGRPLLLSSLYDRGFPLCPSKPQLAWTLGLQLAHGNLPTWQRRVTMEPTPRLPRSYLSRRLPS